MKKEIILLSTLFIFFCCYQFGHTQSHSSNPFTKADTLRGYLSENRKSFDVKYYGINITVDTSERTINGFVKIYFEALGQLDSLQLDLFANMKIEKIENSSGGELNFSRELNTFYVSLGRTVNAGEYDFIRVFYSGKPHEARMAPWDGGFVWTLDNNGDLWISTAVQGLGASSWYPCKDHQSDKPDSVTISVKVPTGFQNISNGRLRSVTETEDGAIFEWFVSYPINTYNVCLNIGRFEHFSDIYINQYGDTLTLDFYVKDYNVPQALLQFQQVIPMLECFEDKFGKYPFYNDGYKVVETPFAGMEHQSAIAYGNDFRNGYRGVSASEYGMLFDYILIHETAHEWWGNNITSNDIADMWIHEGFGTYAEAVYVECLFGYEAGIKYINDHKYQPQNKRPISGIKDLNNRGSVDMYRKGMLILNTLRHVIDNDNLWWEILKGLNEEFRHSSIDGEDVINYINSKTGINFDKFFEQYLSYADIPDLIIEKNTEGSNTVVKFRWETDVEDFWMPVRLNTGKNYMKIFPSSTDQEIVILNTSPDYISVDTETAYIKLNGKIF